METDNKFTGIGPTEELVRGFRYESLDGTQIFTDPTEFLLTLGSNDDEIDILAETILGKPETESFTPKEIEDLRRIRLAIDLMGGPEMYYPCDYLEKLDQILVTYSPSNGTYFVDLDQVS